MSDSPTTLTAVQRATLDRARVAAATPVLERRLRGYAAREQAHEQAAMAGRDFWTLAVDHSSHDHFHHGILVASTSYVLVSREEYPEAAQAEQTAYLMGHARGTYPSGVRHT